jgi:cyclophilin family peptidyl-prolyl cis-trans isomerase
MKSKIKMLIAVAACAMAFSAAALAMTQATPDPENTLYLDLKDGRVVIEMQPQLAPKHVARIKELTRQGFYNGLKFHRVIPGFMAQGGDPTGTGTSGSGQNIPAEFTAEPFVRGTVGMARAMSPDSADSQFFIMFEPNPSLNNNYTVWGKVVSGMEFVDKIAVGEPPMVPDTIVKMQVAADADKAPTAPVMEAPAKEVTPATP